LSISNEAFRAARHDPNARASLGWYLCSVAAGLLIPCLIVMTGAIAALLEGRGITRSPVRLGAHLSVPVPESWTTESPLIQLSYLVAVSLVLAVAFAIAAWGHRRGSDRRGRGAIAHLHRELLRQSIRRAEIEGAIAQRERAEILIEEKLPQLSRGLIAWWLAFPRSVLLVISSIAVALLVSIPLASLAVIGGLLLWQFYQWLRGRAEDENTAWELPRSRRRMVDLLSQSPLLAKTHSGGAADQGFEAELDLLMRRIARVQASRSRLMPLLWIAFALVIAILVLGLGVNLLSSGSPLSVTSALVLGLALASAVSGATRLTEAMAGAAMSDEAARSIYQFLRVVDDAPPSEQRVGLAGVRDSVEIEDVGLSIEGGNVILSGVSLEFRPGELIALMGTRSVSALALAELLLGIGRPSSGRILFDGIALKDIHPRSITKNVLWIGADGPIGEGTLLENLVGQSDRGETQDLMGVVQSLGIESLLTRLDEGQQTILSSDDRRLSVEEKYSIGIARAVIHRPSIVVVQEPPASPDELGGDRALVALRKLADDGSLVIVLPRRLPTLRCADRVVLLNGPKLAGEGKHSGLLQSSDLYRHLNYLLFNPYRSIR
jgi:ABC-type multidrug transport system fused ATPase/permease subunit